MSVAILGAGAFGTALAIARGRDGAAVTLWARDAAQAEDLRRDRVNVRYLPGCPLPESVSVTTDMKVCAGADIILLTVPTRALAAVLSDIPTHPGQPIVACAKGIDLDRGEGPSAVIARLAPGAIPAVLTGPSFAADVARGLPTALTLACADDPASEGLQSALATPVLRLYRTTDVAGAEMGGALKNVIAIAAGIVIGAGLGDSARAALMTRGFAEMTRFAVARGARPETLAGLSGLGDLVLTCTSPQSRNFRYGLALGSGQTFDSLVTVEGAGTARAVAAIAGLDGTEMPVCCMVADLIDRRVGLDEAVRALMARPLRKE
jgi:glycerol-3-phosphate dehydrogenase (NAD(P)+)